MNILVDRTSTLLKFLEGQFPQSSKRTLLNWIKNGRIDVDKILNKKSFSIVKKDQKIRIKSKEKILPYNIKIVYEDSSFLIIEKPSNILSVPKDIPNSINALKILRKYYNSRNIYAVHRIDKETSGLLVFAKSMLSLEKLKKLFKNHEITRKYLAIVEGMFLEEKGKWENYLKEDKNDLKVYISTKKDGEKAITHFKTLHRNKKYTFLSLSLETGKKHQIRMQLKEKGFPVVGDSKYGDKKSPIKRMALHAYLLEFTHPFTGKKMSFFSHIPQEFSLFGADKIKDLL